jgi:hypothetical protein
MRILLTLAGIEGRLFWRLPTQVVQEIKVLRSAVSAREKERAERATLVQQERLNKAKVRSHMASRYSPISPALSSMRSDDEWPEPACLQSCQRCACMSAGILLAGED